MTKQEYLVSQLVAGVLPTLEWNAERPAMLLRVCPTCLEKEDLTKVLGGRNADLQVFLGNDPAIPSSATLIDTATGQVIGQLVQIIPGGCARTPRCSVALEFEMPAD